MHQLLIVSPNFPPVSAADMHRVRMSLPHFVTFGWNPRVLAVGGTEERVVETELLQSVPQDVDVVYASALPVKLTRLVGVGNLALRSFGQLYRAGLRLIRAHDIDLVYVSTTMFPAMALGRLWKAQTGVPFVVDMQDPWISDYLDSHPEARPRKYGMARRLHGLLEPFTMGAVDGVIAVSPEYHETLRRRYPRITEDMCETIPFGAAEEDMHLARELDWRNPWFDPRGRNVNIVSVGRGGRDLDTAASVFFRALRRVEDDGDVDSAALWFVGTDYAPGQTGQKTISPVAEREGVTAPLLESPGRIPYLQALRLLQDADVLVILGSDDAHYAPSKAYPYLLAGKPVVGVLHEDSPAVTLLREAARGPIATFRHASDVEAAAEMLAPALGDLLRTGARSVGLQSEAPRAWLAPELTRRQCEIFDRVVEQRKRER